MTSGLHGFTVGNLVLYMTTKYAIAYSIFTGCMRINMTVAPPSAAPISTVLPRQWRPLWFALVLMVASGELPL